MPDRLNTMWFGDRLGYLEQLSISSALALGHEVTLYSYEPATLRGVPRGVDVLDAREVMSDRRRTQLLDGPFKALGADFFRYEVFQRDLGIWFDLDVLFLKPLAAERDYLFGWENDGISINSAVLRIPAGSPMLEELRNIPESNWCPPFFGPKRRAMYYWKRLTRGTVALEDLPWGVTGPAMITHLARKYGIVGRALPKDVFYPLPYHKAEALYAEAGEVESLITPQTVAIHMWHSRLRALATQPPPRGSFLDKVCRKYGIGLRPAHTALAA